MEEVSFYMEMSNFIDDWDYYNALDYTIKLLQGKDVSKWDVVE